MAKVDINTDDPSEIKNRFPVGSTVKLRGKNEKLRLRRKKATVIGHTTCFVKLQRLDEVFNRSPENITRTEDGT